MSGPNGEQIWNRVDFITIDPQKAFIADSYFCDEAGNNNFTIPGMHWKNQFHKTGEGTKVEVEITFAETADLEKIIEMGFEPGSKGGRPAYDCILMFKILILQRYYNVSDDAMEYAILDRLSFMRFLGLGINDPVPDAKTIWLFGDNLASGNMIEKLFSYLDKQLDTDGIIVHKGKLVDASIVEVPIQGNSRDENKQLKEGEVPEDWSENKFRQKDLNAQWVTHNGKAGSII